MQIFHAIDSIECRLCRGIANALQHGRDRSANPLSEHRGQDLRLIKTALSQASSMQRNRNNQIERSISEPRIHHRFSQPPGDRMPQMELSAVFKLKNDEANYAPASISRDCGIELQFSVSAIRACKFAFDCARKGLGAFRAKWGKNALGFVVA